MTGLRVALLAPVRPGAVAAQGVRSLALGLQAIGCRVTVFAPPGFRAAAGLHLRPYPAPPTLSPASLQELGGSAGPEVAEHHVHLDSFLALASRRETTDAVVDDTGHYLPLALAGTLAVPVLTLLRVAPTSWTRPAVAGVPMGRRRLLAATADVAAAWGDVASVPVLRTAHDLLPGRP